MNTAQGSLVIVGANTIEPKVFFNGAEVADVTSISVANDVDRQRVILTVPEPHQELIDAGIVIKRGVIIFLLIIPEGWTQLDWQYITNNLPNMGYAQVMDYVNTGYIANIDENT